MPPVNLPPVRRGPWGQVSRDRSVIGELGATANTEWEGPVTFDATGTAKRASIDHPPKLALFEITGDWANCEECTSGSSSSSSSGSSSGQCAGRTCPDGWCAATAIPVLYYDGDRIWEQQTDGDSRYIFHPGGYPPTLRDDMVDAGIFMPRFGVGDWVWCIFNQQSGWWEIIGAYLDRLRFELKTDLAPTSDTVPEGGTATAYLRKADGTCSWQSCDAITFTVCDSMGMFEGTGRDSGGLNGRGVGSRGLVEFWADSGGFEIYQMECP